MEQKAASQRRDPLHMKTLRKKFLARALEYVGVPYAQRYHPPECMYLSTSALIWAQHVLIIACTIDCSSEASC